MPRLSDSLTTAARLDLATLARSPERLAAIFAAREGDFPHNMRPDFDALARLTSRRFALRCPGAADRFREGLDRRLCQRDRTPVRWEV